MSGVVGWVLPMDLTCELSADVLASIQDCLHQKMADLASWKTELSNSPQDELYKEEVERVISQVKGLFAEKISQLRSTSVQAEELSKSILEKWGRIFLVSVFNSKLADITVEGAHGGSRVSRAQRWCETIMDLLLDLQKYQILQDADLSRSLNQRSRGKIIWQYLNARIYPAPDAMFLNFDSQLSLKEDASMKKYSTIIQRQSLVSVDQTRFFLYSKKAAFDVNFFFFVLVLTEDAWKNIELSNIIYNAGGFLKGNPGNHYFDLMCQSFAALAIGPNSSANPIIVQPMETFFPLLMQHISSCTKTDMKKMPNSQLAMVKIVYDMLRHTLRYHSKDIPQLPTINFYEMRVFEEAVGFLGSSAHTLNVRSKEILESISELDNEPKQFLPEMIAQQNYLTDSNQNRKISNLDQLNQPLMTFNLRNDPNYLHYPEIMNEFLLNDYLNAEREDLRKSASKLVEQYKSYRDSVALFKSHVNQTPQSLYQSGSFMDDGPWKFLHLKLKKMEEKFYQSMNGYELNIHASKQPSSLPLNKKYNNQVRYQIRSK
jgi:hypothetical protein